MMRLWTVHDDPGHECDQDGSRWQALVWAEWQAEALLLAAAVYGGDAPQDRDYRAALAAEEVGADVRQRLAEYAPPWPRRERRPQVLRLAGWRLDDEDECEACGLAAMGLDQYAVCPDCHCCRECGCECPA